MKVRNKKNRVVVCIFVLVFMLSIVSFFPFINNPNNTNLETSGTNYLFNGKEYPFELTDVYDDVDSTKVYTEAYLQTEYFNGTTLVWSGDIIEDEVSVVNNTNYKSPDLGYYPATYSFEEYADGTEGYDIIDFVDSYNSGAGTSAEIISGFDDHDKVLEMDDQSDVNIVNLYHNFDYTEVDSTIEFWLAITTIIGYRNLYIYLYDENNANIIRLCLSSSGLRYDSGGGDTTVYTFTANTFFHVKMIMDDTADTFDIYVNGNLEESNIVYRVASTSNLYRLYFSTRAANTGYTVYIDAIGYSGDPDYNEGDNLYPNILDMIEGTYDYTDNMEANDDSYSEFTSTERFDYQGTYSFKDEDDGDTGTAVDFIDRYDSNTGSAYARIVSSYQGHEKVLKLYDGTTSGNLNYHAYHDFVPAINYGTIEFWVASTSYSGDQTGSYYQFGDNAGGNPITNIFTISLDQDNNGLLKFYDGGTWYEWGGLYADNTWFHMRIDFETTDGGYLGLGNGEYNFWFDEDLKRNSETMAANIPLEQIQFSSHGWDNRRHDYLDAMGFSWDPNYDVGDNLIGPIPAELDFTIDFNFNEIDTSKLLALDVSSHHFTDVSATIVGNVYDYDSETYTQMFSSSNTAETSNYFVDESSVNDYLDGSGNLRLQFEGTNSNNFMLSIDYIKVSFYYKMDIIIYKSFSINGVWRYRFKLIGSLHYTDWTIFEVIDPTPNFYAISESELTTRWRLQGAEESAIQNFNDDIDPSNAWSLNDVSEDSFLEYLPDISNYLLDDYSFYDSLYLSPTQFGHFTFTKGSGGASGELETNNGANYARIDAGITYGSDTHLGYIVPVSPDLLTNWNEADGPAHYSKLDEAPGDMNGDGGNIRESGIGVDDRWNFGTLGLPGGSHVSKLIVNMYVKHEASSEPKTVIKYTSNVGISGGYFSGGNNVYEWRESVKTGLNLNQDQLNGLYINVEPYNIPVGLDPVWLDIEAVYIQVFYSDAPTYSTNYYMTINVDNPESIETFHYDYRTTVAIDCDLDIYNWETTGWLQLQSNTGTGFITGSHNPTDPYISGSDQVRIRFQSASTTSNFDMYLDQIAIEYNSRYEISKEHDDTIPGYAYIQTNTTELISLESIDYTTHYDLSSGDYFLVDFQTSSDSLINLILLKDGAVNKTLILSGSGNTNFGRHTAQISIQIGEFAEFDQLKISSTFEDEDYVIIHDIKSYKFTLTGDYVDFIVGSKRSREIYLTPDVYNLIIDDYSSGSNLLNDTVIIPATGVKDYVYIPIKSLECRLSLFNLDKERHLEFNDYHITINRSLNGRYDDFELLRDIFSVDKETYVYIDVYDKFGTFIDPFVKWASEPYMDLELEVYSLQIKNLMTQQTELYINDTHYPLLSGDSIYFMLSKAYYQAGYKDTNDVDKQFSFFLNDNMAFELNRSKICFLSYTDQQVNHLYFDDYRTYLNGSLLYENVFYREIGDKIGIEIKDRYGISIKNDTYTVVSGDNYIPIILTMYSLKIMSLQLVFNHVNITRDTDHYDPSPYSWSTWLAPRETVEFRLFAGFYTINITNFEDGGWSKSDFTLNGDDYILIGSNNTIYNVLVNIANVNTTIGNQLTMIEINITNQNSQINNSVVQITINIESINSSLGTMLVDIDTAISNINTSIINEIVSMGTIIENINTSIIGQILDIGVNITNLDTSIIAQFLTLGVNISNINGSIISQILDIGVAITNIETSIVDQVLLIGVDILNLDTSITDQIVTVISGITNINTSILTQISSLSSDIININSSIVSQMIELGVDITNINTSIIDQILFIEVDISNLDTSITEQIVLIATNIENINTTIHDQMIVLSADISNTNSTLLNQMVVLGVDISNINMSITNQILTLGANISNLDTSITSQMVSLGVNLTNINSSISEQILSMSVDLTNINSSIISQLLTLGVNITNINGSIISQIIDLGVDITNINISITEQILSVSVDISNLDTSITEQIVLITADIENVNTTIHNQILVMLADISNTNSTIINQLIELGVDLTNINVSITNQILSLSASLSNINTSITSQILSLGVDLTNINSSISEQILSMSVDLTNINSSIISQLLTLGVSITNINGSIVSQILDIGVNISNLDTSITNQILAIGVDISNLDTSITNQIVSVIANITNINTTLSTQITSLSSDITNINSTIVNQIIELGVDITNINTSLSNQILSLEVDITNINTSIIDQILLVIADIENIETVIDDQTIVILADISNTNSTIINQLIELGVDVTNINASITNQILSLNVDLTNINASIYSQILSLNVDLTNINASIYSQILSLNVDLTNINATISDLLFYIDVDITNIANDINTLYMFTNNSFINLDNIINTSFIWVETNIISINQTISNLVIGVSNDIYLINGTISTIITTIENNLLLMNVSIDTALFNLNTTIDLIGSNITSNYILLNNSISLTNLNINDSRIAMINNLLLINNTMSTLIANVYSSVYMINNSIYTAVVDLGVYLSLVNNTISGNLSIVLQQNEFLTEIYQMTMFSELLNWTDIGLNTTLLTSQIDTWTFINNFKNQSIEIHLRYQDIIDNLTISAQNTLEQYLPTSGTEWREWSIELQKYIGKWTDMPDNGTIDFGFFEADVPIDPEEYVEDYMVIFSVFTILMITFVVIVVFIRKAKSIGEEPSKKELLKEDRVYKSGNAFNNQLDLSASRGDNELPSRMVDESDNGFSKSIGAYLRGKKKTAYKDKYRRNGSRKRNMY